MSYIDITSTYKYKGYFLLRIYICIKLTRFALTCAYRKRIVNYVNDPDGVNDYSIDSVNICFTSANS